MNVAEAFTLGSSGIMTDQQIQSFSNLVNANFNQIQNIGGWLGSTATQYLEEFKSFVQSRAWELSAKLQGKNEYLGYYDIGVINTLDGLQQAQGFMRDYIAAMPGVMEGYQDGNLSLYGGEISDWCTGVGEDNIYYRRQMNGVLNVQTVEDKTTVSLKHYHDSVAGQGLSVRERMDLSTTRLAVDHFLAANMFDFTSAENAYTRDGQLIVDAEKEKEDK